MAKKSIKKSSVFSAMKKNLAGKEGKAFEILDDIKNVNPNKWKDPSQVERLARKYIDKLGLSVPEQRIKQFVNAYQDAIKHKSGADELIQKYGKNLDKETINTLKKYAPK